MTAPLDLEAIEGHIADLAALDEESPPTLECRLLRKHSVALVAEVMRLRTAFATLDYILGNIDFTADVYQERWSAARDLVGWSPDDLSALWLRLLGGQP